MALSSAEVRRDWRAWAWLLRGLAGPAEAPDPLKASEEKDEVRETAAEE